MTPTDSWSEVASTNKQALACFVAAKAAGISGLAAGYTGHGVTGGTLLAAAFLLVATCVALCLRGMKAANRIDETEGAIQT